jgi:hypothetical protein
MLATLLPIFVGFFLTTVLGGLLGVFLQNRTWEHQHRLQSADDERARHMQSADDERLRRMQIAEENRARALQVFDEASRLMDKRLYRLRLAYLSLPTDDGSTDRSASAEDRLKEYQQVLYEWNDSINRNLALLEYYFGHSMRHRLDREVGASFVALGSTFEGYWRAGRRPSGHEFANRLRDLATVVYKFNYDMIVAVQHLGVEKASNPARADGLAQDQEVKP